MIKVSASLSSEGSFTSTFKLPGNPHLSDFGHGSLSLSGTWSGTITLQRSLDNGSSWLDVNTFTANTEHNFFDPVQGALHRAGFKSGDYTSGTANVILAK